MGKKIFFILILFLFSFYSWSLEDLSVHGFISQGFMKSDKNNYLTNSSNGSYEFMETGINFNKALNDKTYIGLQIFARDLGDQGNNQFVLDWGFADYSIDSYSGIRIGKFKRTLGLYNVERDVDLLRNVILLPQSVYDEGMRPFMNSSQGIEFYKNNYTKNKGNFEFQIHSGTVNVPSDSSYLKSVVGTLTKSGLRLSDFSETIYSDTSFGLKWNTPVDGLTTAFSYGTSDGDIIASVDATALRVTAIPALVAAANLLEASKQKFNVDFGKISTASIEYKWDEYTFSYERYRFDASLVIPVLNLTESMQNLGYYSMISKQINDKTALSIYSSDFYKNKDIRDDPSLYQKDFCISLRFDIDENLLFKAEYHDMEGYYHCYDFLNPSGYSKDWNFIALKITVSF